MLRTTPYEGAKSEETTIISNGVKIEGKVSSSGNIRVDGEIQGDITSHSSVTVGENGKVNGQINAENITIGGVVTGIVKAKEKLLLESKAILNGDLFTKILVVESGAKFDGMSKMSILKDTVETKDNLKPSDPIKS